MDNREELLNDKAKLNAEIEQLKEQLRQTTGHNNVLQPNVVVEQPIQEQPPVAQDTNFDAD